MSAIKNWIVAAAAALPIFFLGFETASAEVCGNGIDDESNGYADEGCGFANWVMGVCESPLSCSETGDIDPVTGAWVYQLPADFAPTVPFGPRFEFKRTYMSKYAPPATNYRTSMGNRWQHNFQSWLDKSGSTVVVHMPTGQDVKFTYTSTGGGFDYYNTAQPGAHFMHLRQATASPNHWELKTLTGEVLKFNWASPSGKLIEIWDTLATPNKITIAYFTSGGNNGQIDTVTDASGKKRFKFSYSSARVSSVAYQTVSGGTGTTRSTLSFSYSSSNPTTVSLGGTIQTNTYTSGYLTNVADGGGKTIVNVNYVSATPGKIATVTVANGSLGYDYASSHAQCTGKTALYFNLANTTTCNVDADCGGGYRCGGKQGSGATGKCYRAARCLTTTSPSENLITTVTPFTPCTGACAPVAQYSWNTTTLDLKGIKLADNNWTSFERDANGMIKTQVEGDSDDNATNAGGAKTWFFYTNANFPGRITEARRLTDLGWEFAYCTDTWAGDCKRTIYSWTADGLLDFKQELGFTSGGVGFTYTTDYSYDSKGRSTMIDGPLSGSNDVTELTYWTSADVFKDGYPNQIKRKKDSTNFLITTLDGYDYFGNAGSTQDPDGTFTCRTWDANRNFLTQLREAMAAQASCGTSNSADLVTSYVRDTALRLTRVTHPRGDCEHREYDAFGRLTSTKLRDDCVAGNAGSTRTQTYTVNGQSEVGESLDSTSTPHHRSKTLYLDGVQVAGWENPVSPSYSRSLAYFADASLESITFENNLGKTQWERDAQNRETAHKRYTSASTFLDWIFSYPASNGTSTRLRESTKDPVRKDVRTYVDDLGRRVRMVSPDSGTTTMAHDAASRLVTQVDASGTVDALTHAFTYDHRGRVLTETNSITYCGGAITDVQKTYDALPGGVSCPGGASCSRLAGRVAHIKEYFMCIGDVPKYQETFYGYDDAGRLISEYIKDDTGRTAQQNYSWDKNGNLTAVKAPSGASMTMTYGAADNSDANLVTAIARTVGGSPTTLISGIKWAPFGPVTQYNQQNTISGNQIQARLARNLALRTTEVSYTAGSTDLTTVELSEDVKGRYTQKVYSNVHSSISSDYFLYDWLDRVTCESTSFVSTCPSESANPFNNVSYNTSNDRSTVKYGSRPGYGCGSFTARLDGRSFDHLTSLRCGRLSGSGLGTSPSA